VKITLLCNLTLTFDDPQAIATLLTTPLTATVAPMPLDLSY